MARQANGRILLAGRSTTAGAVVARLRATGHPTWNSASVASGSVGDGTLRAVRVQPDGKIVLAGKLAPSEQMKIIRLNTNGSFDTGFGSAGTATVNVSGTTDLSGDAALQADGRIVVVGPNPDSPFAGRVRDRPSEPGRNPGHDLRDRGEGSRRIRSAQRTPLLPHSSPTVASSWSANDSTAATSR